MKQIFRQDARFIDVCVHEIISFASEMSCNVGRVFAMCDGVANTPEAKPTNHNVEHVFHHNVGLTFSTDQPCVEKESF